MAQDFRESYREQLPRHQKITLERVIAFVGAIAGIVGLYVTIYPLTDWSADKKFLYAMGAMTAVILALLGFI